MNKDDLKYTDDLLFTVKYEKNYIHSLMLYSILFIIVAFIILINTAYIDERIKAQGKVVTKSSLINIQALDGGIVEEIFVSTGDIVKKGDKLIKLDPTRNFSTNKDTIVQLNSKKAQKIRLIEERFYERDKNITLTFPKELENYSALQIDIFNKRVMELNSKLNIIKERKIQKLSAIKDLNIKIAQLEKAITIIEKEISIKKELYRSRAISIEQIYTIEREHINMVSTLKSYKDSISNGIVKDLYFSHKNEVIKPAEIIMDILPIDDKLLIEAKVNPKDIAFIAKDQKATVNITAYDFSIYGGLDGKVVEIGADSNFDKVNNKYYYIVKIVTNKNYLTKFGKKLPIIPGMVASVNIVTGKKSIFDFIFKPIIKTFRNSLHER
ncbi:Type I secretion system, membrane fusion protein LapC [hydrothermal vent metagenome]|uniref:Type I secretion system, membrane fusion protein LapC n=1 Tax=hydrothermal vent metagenome TaxID=652676 RepID=A0A1W1EI66_9ZZZZ